MSTAADLRESLKRLAARIEKEIGRYGGAPSTVRVGGLTKVGKQLELVLQASFVGLCEVQGVDPEKHLTSCTEARSLRRATLGQLVLATQQLPRTGRETLPALLRDLRSRRGSAIRAFIEMRNSAVVHNGAEEPAPDIALHTLRGLRDVMAATVRDCAASSSS